MSTAQNEVWENAQQVAEESSGSNWLKLEDKEQVEFVVRGTPHVFKYHWLNDTKEPCKGSDCQYCEKGNRSQVRFALSLIIRTKDGFQPLIFECSRELFRELHECLKENGFDHLYRMRRYGKGRDTRYRISPRSELTKQQLDDINDIEIHELVSIYSESGFEKYEPRGGSTF